MSVTLKKNSLIEISLYFGIILAILRISTDVILKILDVDATTYYVGYLIGFILEIVLIILAIKKFKKINEGFLVLSDSLKIGIIMMITTGIGFFMSSVFFDQDFQNRKAIEMVEKYNPEQLEITLEKINEAKENPKYFISFGLWLLYFIFLGFVISLVGGSIMKKTAQ